MVVPLGIPAPRLLAEGDPGVIVLEDLGDLYLLLREGRQQGRIDSIRMEALPELFAHETGTEPRTVTDQLVTGGLCWTMNALRWVVETGVHAVPVSRDWIDELVTDLRELAGLSPSAGRAQRPVRLSPTPPGPSPR